MVVEARELLSRLIPSPLLYLYCTQSQTMMQEKMSVIKNIYMVR